MKRFYAVKKAAPESWEARHTDMVREVSARGMVLLENRGGLPLEKGKPVALYGYGARNTAYCGYGAASINSRENISIEQGLLESGIPITSTKYLDRYDQAIKAEEEAYFQEIRKVGGTLFDRLVAMYSRQFTPVCQLPVTGQDVEVSGGDTAVFVITRISGEGADRKPVSGDYLLTEAEKSNLTFLSDHYRWVIVLLNTVGPIDMEFLRQLPHLGAVLFVGLNGGVTGGAAADVLTGRITPEGKLTATWGRHYGDYPNAGTFGLMDGETEDELYSEDIYVGYRYFDSFGVEPAYPFGYGLSYTQFDWENGTVQLSGDTISVTAAVTNKGSIYAGREVLQLYVTCPVGRLDQPAQRLVGFQKTGILKPGECGILHIETDIADLASYSEAENAWVLEKGNYILRVGNSSRNTRPAGILRVNEDAILERCRPFGAKCDLTEKFRPRSGDALYSGENLPDGLPVLVWRQENCPLVHSYRKRERETQALSEDKLLQDCEGRNYTFQQLLRGECTVEELTASLSPEELALVCVGNEAEKQDSGTGGGSLVCASDNTGTNQTGTIPREVVVGASYTTAALLESRTLPNVPMADGGCGIRLLPEYEMDNNGKLLTAGISAIKNGIHLLDEQELDVMEAAPRGGRYWQYTTALPMAVILAQTWDPECWRTMGEIEQREMRRFGVKLWLAPGMNIHRNPLGGRNFEYYSEDPFLTGICAAQIIQGLQKNRGAGATIKHVACNNQEENRSGMNAHVSERALREIYLKGYEIAVRQAKPLAIMTGHNLVNGINSAESYDLLTQTAREEWGFEGLVMTDWGTTAKTDGYHKYGPSDCDACLRAGTDLFMPGSQAELDEIEAALKKGSLDIRDLRWCAANVLRVIQKLWEN